MFEELTEINTQTLIITLVAYAICMLALWKGVSGWETKTQILITIIALPITYLAVAYQLNK